MIIGIGGVSRSGKTSLANQLLDCFPDQKAAILHQDDYIRAGYHIPVIRDQLDWEDPLSIDFQQLSYDFYWISGHVEILILEGLFAFYDAKINKLYDKRILLEIDFEAFYERKKADERWGKVPEWYIRHIWDSYSKFGLPSDTKDILVIDGQSEPDIKQIMAFIGHPQLSLQ